MMMPCRGPHFLRCLVLILALACLVAWPAGWSVAQEKTPENATPAVKITLEAETPAEKPAPAATHQQVAEFPVKGSDGKTTLQTLCVDGKGRILALVAPSRWSEPVQKKGFGEVHVLSPKGKEVACWKVNFNAQAINVGPDGKIYVAGDGRVAQLGKDGKVQQEIQLPHIAQLLANAGELRKQAEDQLQQQKESFQRSVEQIKNMQKKLKAKKPEDLTDQDKRQLEQFDLILKNYKDNEQFYTKRTVDDIVNSMTSRLKIINAVAVSARDIFIVCGEAKGFGFAVWRMDQNFKKPKQVLGGLTGCCGQMDIQIAGEKLLVAENTRHRFACYDRNGKSLGAWGRSGKDNQPGTFGGCCNPMNLRATGQGDIITAESEGFVKRFSPKGDFLGLVGVAKLQGGCKNVAVAVSPDNQRIYFCDQPGSRVIVLAKKK